MSALTSDQLAERRGKYPQSLCHVLKISTYLYSKISKLFSKNISYLALLHLYKTINKHKENTENPFELRIQSTELMEWVRGEMIGKGSYSSVYLATPTRDFNQLPPVLAVKSSPVSQSSLLQQEKEILGQFSDCSEILRCFGDNHTEEYGERFYNLALEFCSRGNLAQLMKKSGGSVPESDAKYFTRSLLQGLKTIHSKGYVHCDIKLQNILVCNGNQVKIGDFGLAKKAGEGKSFGCVGLRGTPLYMSPESVSRDEQEAPMDIWALGCVVAEMVTGQPAWRCKAGTDVSALLFRIGFGDELPEIPAQLSEQGKDFLRKCFVTDPAKRWTAEMLLNHSFVSQVTGPLPACDCPSPSPRSAFDFPDWNSTLTSETDTWGCSISFSDDRIQQLASRNVRNWSSSDSWITIREKTESPVS